MSKTAAVKTNQADTSVVIPAAIRAAAAKADKLHQDAYDTKPQQNDNQQQEQPSGSTEGQSQEPKPAASPAPAPAAQPEGQAPAPQADDWEHKYNSLKGRFDQGERVANGLRQRIAELEAAAARAPAPAPKREPNPELQFKPLTQEERESYGEDFLDVAFRAGAEKFVPTINTLQEELGTVRAQLEATQRSQGMTAAQTMNATLDTALPNWREINRSQKFLDWCALPDRYSGATRISMLRNAHAASDAGRVLEFFKGFLADEAATDPASIQPSSPTPGKPKLEDFAAPGRAKAPAATPAPGAQKETISRSQIANFYALVNKGHYRGNDAEKNRLEKMIFDAERDGLITD